MNYRTLFARASSLMVIAVVASAGCNGLLGNEEATLRAVALIEAGGGGGATCDTTKGNKICFGLCVTTDQPNTGCGGDSCVACDPKNVDSAVCKGTASGLGCSFEKCKDGFGDCNSNPSDGCEASLGTKLSCGACGKICKNLTPLCSDDSLGGHQCVAACEVGKTQCEDACVDTSSSVDHCGGCGNKCPDQPYASASCSGGRCKYDCTTGKHMCGGSCYPDNDLEHCGANCTTCKEERPNMVPLCNAGGCDARCAAGYNDCDGDSSNGCEVYGTCPGAACDALTSCSKGYRCCSGKCVLTTKLCSIQDTL